MPAPKKPAKPAARRKPAAKAAPTKDVARAKRAPTTASTPARKAEAGEKLTAFERAMRDAMIVQRVAEGWGWKDIAAEAGLKIRQSQIIHAREKERTGTLQLLDRDPVQIIEWLLAEHERNLTAFTLIALESDNPSARVGAMRGREQVLERIGALLQSTGKLPKELGVLRHLHDVRALVTRMLDAIDAVETGESDLSGLRQAFYEIVGSDVKIVRPGEQPVIEGTTG